MDIYVDFDRTLYNTDQLYSDMFKTINNYGITSDMFENGKQEFFQKPILFNFIELTRYICNKYNMSPAVISELLTILENGEKYLYSDSNEFLLKMKHKNYNTSILTYGDINFQMLKLTPLSTCNIIDNIIITSNYKFLLDLDYNNSIFIDDNPRDLMGLSQQGAKKVIRVKRKNSKYYNSKLLNNEIPIFYNLEDLTI